MCVRQQTTDKKAFASEEKHESKSRQLETLFPYPNRFDFSLNIFLFAHILDMSFNKGKKKKKKEIVLKDEHVKDVKIGRTIRERYLFSEI